MHVCVCVGGGRRTVMDILIGYEIWQLWSKTRQMSSPDVGSWVWNLWSVEVTWGRREFQTSPSLFVNSSGGTAHGRRSQLMTSTAEWVKRPALPATLGASVHDCSRAASYTVAASDARHLRPVCMCACAGSVWGVRWLNRGVHLQRILQLYVDQEAWAWSGFKTF